MRIAFADHPGKPASGRPVPWSWGGHMDGTGECADIRPQLGVYVTGAIAPADRAAVVQHLASCEQCRDELVGLAALPGLLRRQPAPPAAEPW